MMTACNNLLKELEKLEETSHDHIYTKDLYDSHDRFYMKIELNRLKELIEEIEIQVSAFEALLPKTVNMTVNLGGKSRNKRGLINIGGYILKYLFGTMDHRDMDKINHFIDTMKTFAENVVHTQEQQLTYIQKMNERMTKNTKDIVIIAGKLRDTMLIEVETRGWQIFASKVRELELLIIQVRENLMQLQESLDMTAMGKLSSTLVPPYNLTVILSEITNHLPRDVSMLTPALIENMYVYYQVAEVHACTVPSGIRLFIDIPLKGHDRYFEVYKPYPLPYYVKEIDEFVSIQMPRGSYLAVSENRQSFSILTLDDMNRCREGFYTVCPADFVLLDYTSQHCLIALYLGNDIVVRKNCKRTIEHRNFDPIWIRSPGSTFWTYSLSTPTVITKRCRSHGLSVDFEPSITMTLEGTGVLNDSA